MGLVLAFWRIGGSNVSFKLNIVLTVLTVFSLFVWQILNPNSLDNFISKPYLIVFPIIYFTGLIGLFFIKKIKKYSYAFALSTLLIVEGITSSLASLFPVILPSVKTINEPLTIYNTAADEYGLSGGINWLVCALDLEALYIIVQYRILKEKCMI